MSSKQLLALHRYSSATFKYRDAWAVVVRGNYVFDRKSGPTHRLDLTFKEIGNAAARSLPHGIIGQSFTTNAPRRGKQDVYPASGRFATSAQAEGAIDGVYTDYRLPAMWSTTFKFSQYHKLAKVPVASTVIKRAASTEEWDGKKWDGKRREL